MYVIFHEVKTYFLNCLENRTDSTTDLTRLNIVELTKVLEKLQY